MASLRYHAENRDAVNEKRRAEYAQDPGKHRDRALSWHYENHAVSTAKSREWKKANPDKVQAYNKAHYVENPEYHSDRYAKWAAENVERRREYMRGWYDANPVKLKEYNQKRLSNPKARLENAIRHRIWATIARGEKNGQRSFQLLGYTVDQLREHLEALFQPGMNWENYGEWHVDHIIPLSSFNYERPSDIDFGRAWALSNLQPLWKRDNLVKHAKLSAPFQPSLALG